MIKEQREVFELANDKAHGILILAMKSCEIPNKISSTSISKDGVYRYKLTFEKEKI